MISAPARHARPARLAEIGRGLRELMTELRPDAVAMEEAFHGANVQSALALGEARGVAIFVAAEHGLTVTGYPPATVKLAVVGHGRATKQQIGYLVRALLAMRRTPEPDAADALAIAICHARRAPRRRDAGAARMIAFLRGDIIGDDGDADHRRRGRRRLSGAAQRRDEGGAARRGRRCSCTSTRTSSPTSRCACTGSRPRRRRACSRRCSACRASGRASRWRSWPACETAELVRAIATSDVARLKQVKGVGGKLAERLALELREKILTVGAGMGAGVGAGKGKAPAATATPASTAPVGPLGEVYGALVLLGYKPAEIEPLLEKMDEKKPFDENVRGALAALRRG